RLDRAARRRRGVRLLRRAALRQRPAPLRPPAHRLRQGRRAALPHHVRGQGRAPIRLGHPRAARRARGDARARDDREVRDRGDGAQGVQQRRAGLGAEVHEGVGGLRHPPGPLGRLRQRLQDPRRHLHGVGAVGVQDPVRQGPRLRGLLRPALLLEGPDSAVRARAAHGRRRLPGAPGPDRPGPLPAPFPSTGERPAELGLEGVKALAWPTTPWTLPTNFSLAVGPELEYAVVPAGPLGAADGTAAGEGRYLMASALLGGYAKELGYESAEEALAAREERTFAGRELEHVAYRPLWTVYSADRAKW